MNDYPIGFLVFFYLGVNLVIMAAVYAVIVAVDKTIRRLRSAKATKTKTVIERVRALATEWAAQGPADDWADTVADTLISDCGRAVLAVLDHPTKGATP